MVNEFTKRIENDELSLFEAYHLKECLFYLFEELKEAGFKETDLNYRQIVEWIQAHPEQRNEAWQKIRRGFAIVGKWIREGSITARRQLNSLRQKALRKKKDREFETTSGDGFQKVKEKMIERGIIEDDKEHETA